ncbi:MAG: DNA polymerase III subunit gamma/tau [Bacteroidaceae bacterium]|nr:DNA polymerase III subunit gamma/tau [Bacteroidaceae bacterium]
MENYIVSARKYRPLTFESVVGQQALTQTLKNSIASGKLAHAYLFCGPRGVGKTTCARIFARTINCLNPKADGEACMECESCMAFNEQRSYNIQELDAASNNSVEEIRSLIDKVQVPPQIGKYKVFIIDEVHMLSQAAFNAFLKTLEEPPAHAIFIMATTEKHKILPTILSRCQVYEFNRMSVNDIVGHLTNVANNENVTFEPEALNVIAQKADGGMRDALSIFDQVVSFTGGNITYQKVIDNLNVLDQEYYFKLTEMFLKVDITNILLTLNDILSRGFDAKDFIDGLASHLRNLLVSHDEATVSLIEASTDIQNRYRAQAKQCKDGFLYRALRICNECGLNYRESRNKRLLVELALIETAQLNQTDGDSAGRKPRMILKPIFSRLATKKVMAGGNNATAQQGAAAQESATVAREPEAKPMKPAGKIPTSASEIMLNDKETTKRVLPTVKLSSLSTSIRRPVNQAKTATPAAQASQAPLATPANKRKNVPLSEERLNQAWLFYTNNLPKNKASIIGRMKNITPIVTGENSFSITVENDIAKDYMVAEMREIKAFLAKELSNDSLEISIEIDTTQKTATSMLNPRQLYDKMAKENPSLDSLKEKFELEFN